MHLRMSKLLPTIIKMHYPSNTGHVWTLERINFEEFYVFPHPYYHSLPPPALLLMNVLLLRTLLCASLWDFRSRIDLPQ